METITRRTLVKAFPFFGAALAAPVVASASPDGAVIPLEVAEAIADWNRKSDAAALAWQAYDEKERDGRYCGSSPLYYEWCARSEEVEEAQGVLLRALRETDLDLAAIYRRA